MQGSKTESPESPSRIGEYAFPMETSEKLLFSSGRLSQPIAFIEPRFMNSEKFKGLAWTTPIVLHKP